MGAAAATQFISEAEALKAGKTQEEIDAWKKSNAASAVASSPAIAGGLPSSEKHSSSVMDEAGIKAFEYVLAQHSTKAIQRPDGFVVLKALMANPALLNYRYTPAQIVNTARSDAQQRLEVTQEGGELLLRSKQQHQPKPDENLSVQPLVSADQVDESVGPSGSIEPISTTKDRDPHRWGAGGPPEPGHGRVTASPAVKQVIGTLPATFSYRELSLSTRYGSDSDMGNAYDSQGHTLTFRDEPVWSLSTESGANIGGSWGTDSTCEIQGVHLVIKLTHRGRVVGGGHDSNEVRTYDIKDLLIRSAMKAGASFNSEWSTKVTVSSRSTTLLDLNGIKSRTLNGIKFYSCE